MTRLRSWVMAGAIASAAGLPGAWAQDAGASAPAAAASAPSGIPFKRETASAADTGARTVGALLLVLSVGAGALYLLRGRAAGGLRLPGGGQRLQVLETRRIGAKGTLVLVQWDGEELLLSHDEGGTRLLAREPAQAPKGGSA